MKKIAISLAAAALLASSSARAAIDLQLSYTVYLTGGSETQAFPGSLEFVLEGGEVLVYDTTNGSRTLLGSRSNGYGNFYGPVHFTARYRSGSLNFVGSYRTHTISLVVRTNGQSSCHASISYRLKPGASYYEIEAPGIGTIQVSRMASSGVACRLSTT